jgi:predicted HAD superfamily hydrolase
MLYSFDVFDTLITRATATPRGIFALLQYEIMHNMRYKGLSCYIKENFYQLRIHAEELARLHYQRNGIEDVTLEQIYEALGTTGCLSKAEGALLAELERKTECANVIGIQENIAKVKSLLVAKQKVVLISDMYLDETTIREMLTAADPIFKELPLYVSSEYKQGKHSGNLYKIVKESENAAYTHWTHVGDNPYCDVAAAKKLGISAFQFTYAGLMPIEAAKLKVREADYSTQLCLGTARNARLRHQLSGPAAIGCTVAGPILLPYVQWILEMSRKKGITRLYFIARDGFILKKIADVLIGKFRLAISTHYIYGSRKVWRMPAYDGQPGSLRKLLSWSYPQRIKSLARLAEALQISYEDLMRFLPVADSTGGAKLSYAALCIYIIILEKNTVFRTFLQRTQQKRKKIVQSYLQQELDLADDHFAFVDLGGGGLTQGCLTEIMKDFYINPIRTFFFKMDKINLMNNCIYYNFLPSKLKNDLVIEMICRASHGQTEGYTEVRGKFVPVLQEGESASIVAHGYDAYVDGIEKFAQGYADIVKKYNISVKTDLLLQYLEYIMYNPDKEILDFFADMPNSVTGREKQVAGFAPKLTKQNIRDIYLLHADEAFERYYTGTDLEYAKLRCSKSERRKIALYQTYRRQILARFERVMKIKLMAENDFDERLTGIPYAVFGRKFVIYGAGKFGKAVYSSVKKTNSQVVQWLDENYEFLSRQGLPVTGNITSLGHIAYDVILIAILNSKVAGTVRQNLLAAGVEEKKIICLAECMTYLDIG